MAESPMLLALRCQWGADAPCSRPATTFRPGDRPAPHRFAVLGEDGAWHHPVCPRHVAPRKWGQAPAEVRKTPAGCWHAWLRGPDAQRIGNAVCKTSREDATRALAEYAQEEFGGRAS